MTVMSTSFTVRRKELPSVFVTSHWCNCGLIIYLTSLSLVFLIQEIEAVIAHACAEDLPCAPPEVLATFCHVLWALRRCRSHQKMSLPCGSHWSSAEGWVAGGATTGRSEEGRRVLARSVPSSLPSGSLWSSMVPRSPVLGEGSRHFYPHCILLPEPSGTQCSQILGGAKLYFHREEMGQGQLPTVGVGPPWLSGLSRCWVQGNWPLWTPLCHRGRSLFPPRGQVQQRCWPGAMWHTRLRKRAPIVPEAWKDNPTEWEAQRRWGGPFLTKEAISRQLSGGSKTAGRRPAFPTVPPAVTSLDDSSCPSRVQHLPPSSHGPHYPWGLRKLSFN